MGARSGGLTLMLVRLLTSRKTYCNPHYTYAISHMPNVSVMFTLYPLHISPSA